MIFTNKNRLDMVELLLSVPGIDVNSKDNDNRSALWVAFRNRYSNIADLLLSHGAVVDASDDLLKYIKSGNIVINKYPSAKTTEPTESEKARFKQAEDVEAMKQIIETTNIDVNFGEAILEAVGKGHNEIVELLIAAGADVNIGSAITKAAHQGRNAIVKLLIAAGADVNRKDEVSDFILVTLISLKVN